MPETTPTETTPDYTLHRPHEELDPGQKPLELIETEITELAAHINAATARWLLLIAEFDQRQGWADWGCQSAAHWLMWRCGLSPSTARDHVRVAGKLSGMPQITAVFAAGELSFSQVRALSRVANEQNEADLLMWARHGTAAQIERMVRDFRHVKRIEELEDYRRAHASRYLRHSIEPDGSVVIKARLSPEEGALVLRALEEAEKAVADCGASAEAPEADMDEQIISDAAEPLARDYEEGRDRATAAAKLNELSHSTPSGRRAADALVVMAETVLEAGPQARSGGDRNMVVVHVDIDALRGTDSLTDDAGDRCEIAGVGAIPPELARQLGCDASIVTMIEKDGEILSVGRKTRKVPAHIRRAVRARDKGCRFSGCTHTRFVHDHHIEHWAPDEGETKLSNLVTLCRFHHRFVHAHGYKVILGDDGTVTFVRPDGTIVRDASAEAPSGPGIVAQNKTAGLDINPGTSVTKRQGDAMDYDVAVSHLLWCERDASDETADLDGVGDRDGGSTRPTFDPDELGDWLG